MNTTMKFVDEKHPYESPEKRQFLLHILDEVEPVFNLYGKLEMSKSERNDYKKFCDSVGFTPTRPPYQRSTSKPSSRSTSSSYSSSSSSSSTYTPSSSGSSYTEEDNAWVGWIFGIIVFLVLMANC